jgi:DNA-binding NarL/FixJ family response regulator
MKRASVVLADDHCMILDGLRSLLQEQFDVVDAVTDGMALVGSVARLHPELAVVDVSMPALSGLEATREIRKAFPDVKVVILTMHAEEALAEAALAAGASAFVLKNSAASELRTAMEEVLAGRLYVSPEYERLRTNEPSSRPDAPAARSA